MYWTTPLREKGVWWWGNVSSFWKVAFEKKKHTHFFGHFVFRDVRKKPNDNTHDNNARRTTHANTNYFQKKSATTLDDFVPFGVQSDESFPSREGNDFHQHRVEEDNKEDEEEKNERRR